MMEGAKPRFICILEPTGTWAVWDEQRNLPGEITEPLVEAYRQQLCTKPILRVVTPPPLPKRQVTKVTGYDENGRITSVEKVEVNG